MSEPRSLVVVGSVALDDVETASEAKKGILGGSASFFSVGASLFCPVRLVAVVGTDFPQEHLATFRDRNVDLAGLEVRDGKTFHWAGRYSADFAVRTSLATDLNVFADFDPKLPGHYRDATHVFLANIHPDLQHKVLGQWNGRGVVAADTMNYWIDNAPDSLHRLLPKLHILFLNDEEVRMLGRASSVAAAAEKVLSMGPKSLVVKRGEHGASLYHEDGSFHLPAFPVRDVVDPTGAGDTFAAGFMGYLTARGSLPPSFEDLKHALAVGTALASFTVQGFSLEGLIKADRDAVHGRYRALAETIRFTPLEEL